MEMDMANEAHIQHSGALPEWVFPSASTAGEAPPLALGQIWRTRWDDLTQLVLIDSLPDDINRLRVSPVEIGDGEADDDAIILPADETHLDVEFSVWPTLTTDVPAMTLDCWVATVRSYNSEQDILQAANAGTLRRGHIIANDVSPRLASKRILGYSAHALHLAGQLRGGQGNLRDLLEEWSTAALSQALDGDTPLAVNLKRGVVVVDPVLAQRIESATTISAEDLLDANPAPPTRLMKTLWARERGSGLREVAQKRRETQSEAFAHMTQGVLALAARGEKRDEVDWEGRVDTYLHMALVD